MKSAAKSNTSPQKSLRVVACGALANEILAIKQNNALEHLDLVCVPAILHNSPNKIPSAVESEILKAKQAGFSQIFIGFADCGTGGRLDKICEKHGVKRIDGPHCYAFFSGNEAFSNLDEIAAFYLTDFLANQFERFVVEPLGLDKHPELIGIYFGNYEKLVFLSQVPDPKLTEKAKKAADFLGLSFEQRQTGFGELETSLTTNIKT